LKIEDKNGNISYSNIAKVYFDEGQIISIMPNPVTASFIIPRAKANDRIKIINAEGKIMMNKKINYTNEPVSVAHFSSGVYILQLYSNNSIIQTRFVKQ